MHGQWRERELPPDNDSDSYKAFANVQVIWGCRDLMGMEIWGVCMCVSVCTCYLAGLEIKLSQWAFRFQLLLSREEMRVFWGGM